MAGLARRTLSFLSRLGDRPSRVDYTEWRHRWVEVDDTTRARIDKLVAELPHRPSFTVVMPIDGANTDLIAATVSSMAGQRYENWLLLLTGGDPPDSSVADVVAAIRDSRVRFTGPSPVLPGDWVVSLTPGDLAYEAALFAVADAITRRPEAAVIYTDHDHLGPNGNFADPHMKPDWSPDLLLGMDYFGILTAYRADLWEAHAANAVDAHDLAVAATARLGNDQVVHVPHVLASMRVGRDKSHLVLATVRVARSIPDPPPRVSVLIPTRNKGRMLERCLSSLFETTDYPELEVVIVDHETTETRARKVIDSLAGKTDTQVIRYTGMFNFAALINQAAVVASGDILVLLNNDTEIIEPEWLTELVMQVSRPEVGVAGALLTFSDGTIQHAGIHPGVGGLMGHGHKHLAADEPGYFGRLLVVHAVAAVTGACMAIEVTTWQELGGLDEENLAVAYNDVDLCLRARAAGLRVVLTPHARLVHHESVSRGADDDPARNARLHRELVVMQNRWGDLLDADPAYNPNLSFEDGFQLAGVPRNKPHWSE